MSEPNTDNGKKPLCLEFDDNQTLIELCGLHDQNLQQLEERFGVQLVVKGNQRAIFGNLDQVEKAKANPKLAGWFVGQIMKATGGKANPKAVNETVRKKLG